MGNIGVIINPTGGKGRALKDGKTAVALLEKYAVPAGFQVIDLSAETATLAKEEASKAIASKKIEALVVAGGDGTINLGYNIVANTGVPLGIFPCGSGNDFARANDIPIRQLETVVKGLMLGIENKTYKLLDAGVAESMNLESDESGTQNAGLPLVDGSGNKRYFATVLTGGVDAAISELAGKWVFGGSTAGYMLAVLNKIATIRPYGYKITYKDLAGETHVIEQVCALASAAVTKYYGGGVMIAPEATGDSGYFYLVVAKDLTSKEALKVFPTMYTGKHVDNPMFKFIKATEICFEENVELLDGSGRPVLPAPLIRADGEAVGHFPLRVSIAKEAVKLVMI